MCWIASRGTFWSISAQVIHRHRHVLRIKRSIAQVLLGFHPFPEEVHFEPLVNRLVPTDAVEEELDHFGGVGEGLGVKAVEVLFVLELFSGRQLRVAPDA